LYAQVSCFAIANLSYHDDVWILAKQGSESICKRHTGFYVGLSLVYTVESTMVAYGDTGIWSIYFGCDEHDVKRCLRLVRKELDKFMQKPLSEAQLKAAKKQIKGQVGVACDNRENFALDFGKSFLHYGWEKNVDRLYEQVDEITAEQIQAVAQELFDKDRLTTLIFR
jgi:predicted Zn-dependent peptidase